MFETSLVENVETFKIIIFVTLCKNMEDVVHLVVLMVQEWLCTVLSVHSISCMLSR